MQPLVLAGLLSVLLAASGSAQTPSTSAGGGGSTLLTEAEFLAVLTEAHPSVGVAAQAVAMAEARVRAAETLENPVLSVGREDLGGSSSETEVVVSWQLPEISRRALIMTRESEVAAAEADLAEAILAQRFDMRAAYAAWAIADERRRRLASQLTRVESLTAREAVRAEQGEASGLNAHRLRLAATALRSRVVLAATASDRARGAILRWVPDLAGNVRPVLPDRSAAPELKGSSARVMAAEQSLEAAMRSRAAAGRFWRSPELSLGWKRQEAKEGAFETSDDGVIVGVSWALPFFDRKQGERAIAESRVEGAQATLELARREAVATSATERTNFARLTNALEVVGVDLANNERMLNAAEAAFQDGEAELTELLDTHRSVTEAELAMLDLYEAVLTAHRNLERLARRTMTPAEPTGPTGDDLTSKETNP